MAKTKKTDHPPVRQKIFASVEEIQQGIEKLRGRMFQVEELKKDGVPYRDAMRVSAEFQIRESIRDIFGERSPEFQEHQHHRIKSMSKADLAETRALLEHLIAHLEDKKQELLGLDPVPEEPSQGLIPSPASKAEPAAPVVPAAPAKALKSVPSPAAEPGPAAAPPPKAAPPPAEPPPPPPRPAAMPPPPTPPPSAPVMTAPHAAAGAPPSSGPAYSPPPSTAPPPASGPFPQSSHHPAVAGSGAPSAAAGLVPPAIGGPSSLEVLRKICTRFHLIARKLRQRREDRPTLEVEDESDVQDVIHALLSLEFDDIRTEEWTPGHGRTSRMDFLLPVDGIILEVKKTRQGFGAKEIASQLWVDFQRYLARPDCKILFCFVYDPEGRIGNPRRLETELTRVSDGKHVEVLISPK